MLKQELIWRNKKGKNLLQKETDVFICALMSEEYNITNVANIEYIIQLESETREVLMEGQKDADTESERRK